jgi:hypothetical protein
MAFVIPNRPFATEPITGLMMPDGIFEASIGKQTLNAHVKNTAGAMANIQVYVESVSDPGIVITPATYPLASAANDVAHLFSWQADFTAATPGAHLVSFIVETPGGDVRIIKKIFVTKLGYNPADGTFTAIAPEGVMTVAYHEMIRPRDRRCRCKRRDECHCGCDGKDETRPETPAHQPSDRDDDSNVKNSNVLEYITQGFKGHDPKFEFCLPGYLPKDFTATVVPTPAYAGQYGDLPFQDPWWKVLLCILALLLLIGAAIAEAVDGSGEVTVSGGSGGSGSPDDCCGIEAGGGGTSYIAAGLVAAAAAVATAAAASDVRDPFRKGADHTAPGAGQLTTQEDLKFIYNYSDPIELGKPFKVGADWKYTRHTTAASLSHATTETNANVHLLSKYEVKAPDTVLVYKREQFIIEAQFFDANNKQFKGEQLFVQCFLIGPAGQLRKLVMQDNGQALNADKKANDGIYTGRHFFSTNDKGLWTYFVIAQDINTANPDMEPEEAAQIIGGMVLTNQLTITFDGGTCPLVPDGHVNVIAP